MKLPFPKKDGVSVLVDTYSDNDVPLAISQVEIIIRGSDVVIRTQDGSELILVQAAQMASMHENLFDLKFADGTVVSSNELFQRADLIEPGPELSDIKENNAASESDSDPLVVVQSSAPSEASDRDAVELASTQTVNKSSDARISVSEFIGPAQSESEEVVQVVSTKSSGTPSRKPSQAVEMPDPMMPTKPTPNGDDDNKPEVGFPYVQVARLYQIANTKTSVSHDDGTVSSIWSLGGGSNEARTNPDIGVQYGQPAILDLRGTEGENNGFVIHADNDAFKYHQINTNDNPNNLYRRLGRIVTFDQLVGGQSVSGQTIKNITNVPDSMTAIWKGSPDYADFVAKYGIELKDNEVFINYKASTDYRGNSVNITWVDANGHETTAKAEFTNHYDGDYPNTVVNGDNAIVLSNKPNAREIYGGEGDDTVYASEFNNKISYDGGGGVNRLIFGDNYPLAIQDGLNSRLGLEFDAEKQTITDLGRGDIATVKNFTEFVATRGDDHFIGGGTATSYYVDGLDGNNIFDMQTVDHDSGQITGSGGNNQLFAGNGQDLYNLVNSTGHNIIVDRGKDGSDDTYNFSGSTGVNKITDSGGADKYNFDRASNSVSIDDFAAGNDIYNFHNINNATVAINDSNNGTSVSGNDIYDFAILKTDDNAATATDYINNSAITITDENGSDGYRFERAKDGVVTIFDQGNADGKSGVQDDKYDFSESATKVIITDQDGADSYNFNKIVTSKDNTVTILDNSTSSFADIYNFDDITSVSLAEGDATNVWLKDQGGDNIFNFNRLASKIKIDENGAGNDTYNFNDTNNSDVTITDREVGKDIYNFYNTKNSLIRITDSGSNTSSVVNNQDDIYNFSQSAANNVNATDFIENSNVFINDGRGNDLYYFERTKGGSITINDTDTSSNPSVGKDAYFFDYSNTKVNISDGRGIDSYNFNNITLTGNNLITISDTGGESDGDSYNFNNLKATTALSGNDYHVSISDSYGGDNYNFNDLGDANSDIVTRVKIYDTNQKNDTYSFLRANNAYVNIRDTGNGNDDKYIFSDMNNSNDHMTNSNIYIRDDVGQDKYYFNGAIGGSVTIEDNGRWQNYFYFNNIQTKVNINADSSPDYYYFKNSITTKYNTITISNNSNNCEYDFSGTTATSLTDDGNYNIDITDGAGRDSYKFVDIKNTKIRITDGDGGNNSDDYNFTNAKSSIITIYENGKSDTNTYYFNKVMDSKVTINDNSSSNHTWGNPDSVYNFGTSNAGDKIGNTDVVIVDGSGCDNYNFLYADGGTVNITDNGGNRTYNGASVSDNYNFSHSNIKTVTIKDQTGASNYDFSNSGSDTAVVKIVDQNSEDSYNFQYAKGNITIYDGGTNSVDSSHQRVSYNSYGQMTITGNSAKMENYNEQIEDKFDFKYSSAKVQITDGITSADAAASGVDADAAGVTSNGLYYFQYSKGDVTIVNRSGIDKYFLGGSTGKISILGGTDTDIVYVGKGTLVYDGGTRSDGGKENDWISFQDVVENTDKNGNKGTFDPNERSEGIYINLAQSSNNFADRSQVNYDETTGVASIAAGMARGDVKNVEHVIGSKFADLIYGDAHDNYFLATRGGDIYYGGGGSDTYFVGAPNIGGRIDGLFYNGINPTDADLNAQDRNQMAAWDSNPTINPNFQILTIDLDKGYATTLWEGSDGNQLRDILHDINNANGALNFINEITGRWGTEGRLIGGYKADTFYSVANSSKDGISYIDGNNGDNKIYTQNDTLHYDYIHQNGDGTFQTINGVYVKMTGSFSGTTVKGFTGFDANDVAQGTQGHDQFKSIGTIIGTSGNDIFEGSQAGGHKFFGGGGQDIFISHGGTNSSYTNGDLLDYSKLDAYHSITVDMNNSSIKRDLSYIDTIANINNIKGTQGNDSVVFTDKLIGFDGQGGNNYMLKKQNVAVTASDYTIESGYKNVQGISFIDDKSDNVKVDFDKFFNDYMNGAAGDDGHYHAKFFLNGVEGKDANADIFSRLDNNSDGKWDWRQTNDGNTTIYHAYDRQGNDTGNDIQVIRGSQGDNTHLQESHPSM
ncbi:hypothetical protein [uncultured Bartonella sp.]|uniref:beta strand repeat-containing protein n=1 Tax=uncultured Bartonella sp. TaxID=104108 RepID=UPI0026206723|nr:hypothetical protein [uncultured Bartonella sp.]